MPNPNRKKLRDLIPGVNSLSSIAARQRNQEAEVSKALKIQDSSYSSRARVNDINPDYVGPMGDAGRGTRDRMPGSTPSISHKNGPKKPDVGPNKKRKKGHFV